MKKSNYLMMITTIGALGGLLFGYDFLWQQIEYVLGGGHKHKK